METNQTKWKVHALTPSGVINKAIIEMLQKAGKGYTYEYTTTQSEDRPLMIDYFTLHDIDGNHIYNATLTQNLEQPLDGIITLEKIDSV